MAEIRFIRKDGERVDGSIVCQHFFEVAVNSGITLDHASAVWHDAIRGDPLARDLVEDLCNIEIVSSSAGFGL